MHLCLATIGREVPGCNVTHPQVCQDIPHIPLYVGGNALALIPTMHLIQDRIPGRAVNVYPGSRMIEGWYLNGS